MGEMESGVNLRRLGANLNSMRKEFGYRNTEEFSKALAEKAGYFVSKDTVYRIESGRQEPGISYLCAVGLALYGNIFPPSFSDMLRACACENWAEIEGAVIARSNEQVKKLHAEGKPVSVKDGRFFDEETQTFLGL